MRDRISDAKCYNIIFESQINRQQIGEDERSVPDVIVMLFIATPYAPFAKQ